MLPLPLWAAQMRSDHPSMSCLLTFTPGTDRMARTPAKADGVHPPMRT